LQESASVRLNKLNRADYQGEFFSLGKTQLPFGVQLRQDLITSLNLIIGLYPEDTSSTVTRTLVLTKNKA
jgi:hypothetical protein